jgi:hypothetical protein
MRKLRHRKFEKLAQGCRISVRYGQDATALTFIVISFLQQNLADFLGIHWLGVALPFSR